MGTPHKYAEVIKAWADGEQIQFRNKDMLWVDFKKGEIPAWYNDVEYRVKPELKDPGPFLKGVWYKHLGISVPRSAHQDDIWKYAAIELLKAYKAGELKDIV